MSTVEPGCRPSDCVPPVLGQDPKDIGDDRIRRAGRLGFGLVEPTGEQGPDRAVRIGRQSLQSLAVPDWCGCRDHRGQLTDDRQRMPGKQGGVQIADHVRA